MILPIFCLRPRSEVLLPHDTRFDAKTCDVELPETLLTRTLQLLSYSVG